MSDKPRNFRCSHLLLSLLGALFVPLLVFSSAGEANGAALKIPGADLGLTDAAAMREKAMAAETKEDWNTALTCWERVIDRSLSTRAQRLEAFTHIYSFRDKVTPVNTDPAKAKPWPTLVVSFRTVDFSYDANGKTERIVTRLTKEDEQDIRDRVAAFGKYVFTFTDGIVKIEPEFLFIDEPLTTLSRSNTGRFSSPPRLIMPFIEKHVKGANKQYYHTMVYTKLLTEDGKRLPAPFGADTGFGGLTGGSYMDCPFYPKSFGGQSGEIELHEWLHPVDMIFSDVLGYPDDIARNPDQRSGDNIYQRPQGEHGIVSLYNYIFRVRYTRLMWSELTIAQPKEFFWGGPNFTDWMVLGPLTAPEGVDPIEYDFIDVTKIDPKQDEEFEGKRWTQARSMGGFIDLRKLLGDQKNAVAYLVTGQRILGRYNLRMGSAGPNKAYLNGDLVYTNKTSREFAFNLDKVEIGFKPGYSWNLYVFKVQNTDKGWKFQARVTPLQDDEGNPWGSAHMLPGAK
jgi:hypothetical protein